MRHAAGYDAGPGLPPAPESCRGRAARTKQSDGPARLRISGLCTATACRNNGNGKGRWSPTLPDL